MNRHEASNHEAINAETVDFLLSDVGRAAAARLNQAGLDDAALLAQLTSLRRDFTPAQAGALVALARLRRRAAAKFPAADQLFFTAEALEQATAEPVASHRAAWIDRHAPPGPVLDLGCGIGGDLLALAQRRPVIAFERDAVRARLAAANAAVMGLAGRVTVHPTDWVAALQAGTLDQLTGHAAAAFADPARRTTGKGGQRQRVFRLAALIPPIDTLLALQARIPALGVKVMPSVDDDELPAGCGVEFISHAGTCKEAVLWFGPLAGPGRWASVHTPDGWETIVSHGGAPPLGPLAEGMTLYEPDPAVIRAGAFAELCARLGAHLFAPDIAYLVADSAKGRDDPLVQSFVIQEIHPFSLKRLQERLAARQIGQVELKKRGAPFAPESLRGRLKPVSGGSAATVIFTRRGDERLMIIAQRPV